MDLSYYYHLIEVAQSTILDPGVHSLLPMFVLSAINEFFGIFPYVIAVAGQLIFITYPIDLEFFIKLVVFVTLPLAVGGTLGTMPMYLLAYWGGKPLVRKYGQYLHFSWDDVERVTRHFNGHWYDWLIFLAIRSVPIFPAFPMSLGAGFLRIPVIPYSILTFLGSAIRMTTTFLFVVLSIKGLSEVALWFYN